MMTEDVYETIRRNMNSIWPVKMPKHNKILQLLKLFWPTEEEAKILSVFKQPLVDLKGIKKISKLTGLSIEQVLDTCEKMAKKGVIAKDGKKYLMLPPMPGIVDFYFIAQSDTQENLEKVAKLWLEIEDMGLANEIGSSDYPLFRTLPASSLPEKVTKEIKIDEKMKVEQEILIFEDVTRYIKQAKSIVVVNCVCRTYNAMAGRSKCDKPVNICIYLNTGAELAKSLNLGREITHEEALKLLKQAEDHGLVHNITNGSSPEIANVICNCCPCHCSVMGSLLKHHNIRALASSNYQPQIDAAICKKCEKCIEICPTSAAWHHWPHNDDLSDDYILIRDERCIGCGLCAHHCSTKAISMKKIKNDIPADTLGGIYAAAEAKKRH